MHLTTPPHYTLCHTAACIPLGITTSSGCLPEGSSSHGHCLSGSTTGTSRRALLLLGESGLGTGCGGASTLRNCPPTPCVPASTLLCWAAGEPQDPPRHRQLPVSEQPEVSGLPGCLLLPRPPKH